MLTCLCEAGNFCTPRGTSRIFSLAFFPACLHARRRLVGTNWILGIAPDPINSKNGLRSTQKTFLTTCVLSSGKFFQKSKMNLIILKLLARISFRVLEQKNAKKWHTSCATWCNNYNLDNNQYVPKICPGWQKLHGSTGGTRRKVWTQTKILCLNIRYFFAN